MCVCGGGGGGGAAVAAHVLDVALFYLIRLVTSIAFTGVYASAETEWEADPLPIESFTFHQCQIELIF